MRPPPSSTPRLPSPRAAPSPCLFSYLPMPCSYFSQLPDGLTPTQERAWHQRCQTASRIMAQQAATAGGPDAEVLAYLQLYVHGEITLGQAIGRLLDHQAHR